MHRWHAPLGRRSHRKLLPSSWVARHLWPQWHHLQPRQICIWVRHCWICWLRNNPHQRTAMQEIPWRNTWLPNTYKHHRCAFLVWTHKPSVMLPFRQLLKPATPFKWDGELNKLSEKSTSVIIKEIEEGVRIFDKSKPTCLATDWSKTGIGFWLFQKHGHCPSPEAFCCRTGWKVTLVGSRFTHAAESHYAPVEGGGGLAVADALDKARFFVLGYSDLIIAFDHKPLLKVFSDRSFEEISNGRLRNRKEKTVRYKFTHAPDVWHRAADAVSCHPTGPANPDMMLLPDDIAASGASAIPSPFNPSGHSFLSGIRCREPAAPYTTIAITSDRIKVAIASDTNMVQLISIIESGFPEFRHELPPALREYHQCRDHLYTVDGVILYKSRTVISTSLRQHVLTVLHSARQGLTSMITRAETSVFWPGITPAITATRANCYHCSRMAPSQPNAPPLPPVLPAYPFQCISAWLLSLQGQQLPCCGWQIFQLAHHRTGTSRI